VNVFVVNCGSSSLKYSVVDVDARTELVSGIVERIGEPEGRLKHGSRCIEAHFADHGRALSAVMGVFAREGPPLEGLGAVAHRVVHGGDRFRAPVLIDDDVVEAIRELGALAPLHNPVNALGIEVARHAFPDLPHVAIFDTAFHSTMPPHAYMYAVPREWHVRRFGFHGTSHAYVAREAARVLGREESELDLITLHLGNGASACAIAGGRSVDTSMGLTPLDGLVMGTRSGDVDPALIPYVIRTQGLSVEEIDKALNTRSGLMALAGDNDMREVHRKIERADRNAAVALAVYCYRIRRYVGMYLAALGGADAIVFTAGVGENDAQVRAKSLEGLERLGIAVDEERNAAGGPCISPPGSPVAVLVIPTDEELEMATQAAALVG
jgi:acetate kinase